MPARATGHHEDFVKPPALRNPRSHREAPPNALAAFGPTWHALSIALACSGIVVPWPARAAEAAGTGDTIPVVVIVAGLGLAVTFLIASAGAVMSLLRRSRHATSEARRLHAL